MLVHNLNKKNLEAAFSQGDYIGGHKDYQAKCVKNLTITQKSKTCEVIESILQLEKNYTVRVELNNINDTIHLWGTCTCPLMGGCKHVIATLFEALERDSEHYDNLPLDPNVVKWLKTIDNVFGHKLINKHKNHETHQFLYVLSTGYTDAMQLRVKILFRKYLTSGKLGICKDYDASKHRFVTHESPFLSELDQELHAKLEGMERVSSHSTGYLYYPLEGFFGEKLLKDLIATGRCYWESPDNPVLTLSESKKEDWYWKEDKKGFQVLCFHKDDGVYSLFSVEHLWYIQEKIGAIGLFESALDKDTVKLLLSAPPIPLAQAEDVANMLTKHKKIAPIRTPKIKTDKKLREVTPTPCLYLRQSPNDVQDSPEAQLTFDYDGIIISEKDEHNIIDGTSIQRDLQKEAACVRRLLQVGWFHLRNTPDFYSLDGADQSLKFSSQILPELRDEGWKIEISDDYPYRIIEESIDDWYSSVDENEEEFTSNNNWFDLELGITVKGEKINLLPVLQRLLATMKEDPTGELLRTTESVYAQLADGRYISLPADRVKNIANILIELYDGKSLSEDDKLRLSKLHAMRLLELDTAMGAAQLRWLGGNRLRLMAEKLTQFKGIETVQPPAEFRGELRPYQIDGLSWLQFLREYDLSGILADDMGLGKTVQALSHILLEKMSGRMKVPSLIIAPTSLMFNWRLETEKFAPDLKILILHGSERKRTFENLSDYDVIVTTYALLVRDQDLLLKQPFYFFILDEAQFIKNAKTQAAQIALQIKAKHRLCLTGTPMENHLGELWSLFHFMMPGLLGDQKQFTKLFRTPIEKHGDAERRAHLNRRVAPFMLRRTKDKVMAELPDKIETIQYVELDGPQRDLYETIRVTMQKKVRDQISELGLGRSHIIILEALLKLRQVCCDPRLVKIPTAQKKQAKSAKLGFLMSFIRELLEEGRRILLFSQFTEMLGLIEDELNKEKIAYLKLTGQTKDRQTPVQEFQEGKVPLFLISLKAGGTGLNLTAADTVIHYDPWWNPAVENQATDRAHRIGQNKTVFVYKFVAKGTVEEKILDMQKNKRALMEGLFSTEATSDKLKMTEEDLQSLFDPLV